MTTQQRINRARAMRRRKRGRDTRKVPGRPVQAYPGFAPLEGSASMARNLLGKPGSNSDGSKRAVRVRTPKWDGKKWRKP